MMYLVTFWDLFWLFCIFIPLLLFWVFALVDLFRRADLGPVAVVVWLVVIVVLPILGPVAYLLMRPPADRIRYRGERLE